MTKWPRWAATILVLSSNLLPREAQAQTQTPPARLAAALAKFEKQQYAAAIRLLQSAQPQLPKLGDYLLYHLAAAKFETGDYPGARKEIAALYAFSPPSLWLGKAVLLDARALLQLEDPSSAVALLRERYADLPQPAGDALLGEAYEAAGDLPHAASFYQRVYSYYPAADQAPAAAQALAALEARMGEAYPPPMPALLFTRVEKLVAARRFAEARKDLEFLAATLGGEDRERAQVKLAAIDYLSRDYRATVRRLAGLEVNAPDADAERLYYLVESGRRLDDDGLAERSLKTLQRYPRSPWRLKALIAAANKFLLANQPDLYTPLYRACHQDFPDDPEAASCHWKVVWRAYLQRRRDSAELLREHLTRFPASPHSSAALYYLGRLAEASRDYASAAAYYHAILDRFPAYYYGLLTRDRMTGVELSRSTPAPQAAAFVSSLALPSRRFPADHTPTPATSRRIERARLLRQAGLDPLAEAELRFAARTDAQPHLVAVELARHAPSPFQGLRFMKSLVNDYFSVPLDAAPKHFWEHLFPLPYRAELIKAASLTGLDPATVAGLIRQESEFNPRALSRAKAMGLTQVRPVTGRELARRAGIRRFSTRMLYQPAVNLRLGTLMLRSSLDRWGGKWEPTLAAFNAGPSRPENWITWADFAEPSEFVETIPFTETREYVQSVLRNAAIYRALYGDRLAAEAPAETKVHQVATRPARPKGGAGALARSRPRGRP